MCENEQKPEPQSWKPRTPELEPEPCSRKEELRSRSCVIFTTAQQPWKKVADTWLNQSHHHYMLLHMSSPIDK